MTAVAKSLGVSMGALYRNVEDRDALVELMVELQRTNQLIAPEAGQHWAAFALQHAALAHDFFLCRRALLQEYVMGGIALTSDLNDTGAYLSGLVKRGFALAERWC